MAKLDQERQQMRQGVYGLAYDDAVAEAARMADAEIKAAAERAATFVQRNYQADKKLAASRYEGKMAGYRHVLQQRRAKLEEA